MKKQYTVILRRSNWLCDIYDDGSESDFYVANPDTEFDSMEEAARAAKVEAAKADARDIKHIMSERGLHFTGASITPDDNYEVIFVFEGQHKPKYGWEPELCAINEDFGG